MRHETTTLIISSTPRTTADIKKEVFGEAEAWPDMKHKTTPNKATVSRLSGDRRRGRGL